MASKAARKDLAAIRRALRGMARALTDSEAQTVYNFALSRVIAAGLPTDAIGAVLSLAVVRWVEREGRAPDLDAARAIGHRMAREAVERAAERDRPDE